MTATSGEAVLVSDRFHIDHAQPLPELDYGPSMAFAATDMRDGTSGVYAILPNPKLPLRLHAIPRMRRIDNNNLLRPLAWQVVDWPTDGRRRPVILLERPRGKRLLASADSPFEQFREESLVHRVLQPLCTVLEILAGTGIVHRNIRAENLYLDGDDAAEAPIMLGECVSAPAGYLQPVTYETIECGMADPSGRGEGSTANDLYALGVTACILHTGRNPFAGLSDAEVVQHKLASGSYAALSNGGRISGDLVEVFRGLLNDEPNDRWGLEDLQMWLGGRRASPRQQSRPTKSPLPLDVAGETHVTARGAAEGLSRHWDEGLKLVESGALDDWLRRGLADEDRTDAVNTAKSSKPGAAEADATLSRICIALDPVGPIRMRSVRAMLDGIGADLACRFSDEQARADVLAILQDGLVEFHLATNSRMRPDLIRLCAVYDRLVPVVSREDIGFGVERALYALNENAPCFSPLFEGDYVPTLDQLLPALDRLARSRGGSLEGFVDRHIAAFIAARLKAPIAPELRELRDAQDHLGFALPAARLLALVQDQVVGPPLPALCGVVAATLEPALENFHNRETRDLVRERMQEIAQSGRLGDLIAAVDDREALQIDERRFQGAIREYAGTVRELQRVEYERENRVPIMRDVSNQVASLLSGGVATVAVLVTILATMV